MTDRLVFLGPEFRINDETALAQDQPDVAALSGGGFVAVWTSHGQDGDRGGIYGKRFDAAGTPLGAEFRINAITAGDQTDPMVTGLPDGGFTVQWSSDADGTDARVASRRFDAEGQPIDGDSLGGLTAPTGFGSPDAWGQTSLRLADGSFIAGWIEEYRRSDDSDGWYQPYLQSFDANGTPLGQPVEITGARGAGRIAFVELTTGESIAFFALNADGDETAIVGQRLSAQGGLIGSTFFITPYTYSGVAGPLSAFPLQDGGFLLTGWPMMFVPNPETLRNGRLVGFVAQAGTADGLLAGASLSRKAFTAPSDVLEFPDGSIIGVWTENDSGQFAANTTDRGGVFLRWFTSDLTPLSDRTQVNTERVGDQSNTALALLNDTSLVALWQSEGQDGSATGVYGQRLARNSFPTGTVSLDGEMAEGQEVRIVFDAQDAEGIALDSLSARWLRDGKEIAGETDDTYTITRADAGARLTVEVQFLDGMGILETLVSEPGPVVVARDTPPTGVLRFWQTPFVEGAVIRIGFANVTDADGIVASSRVFTWYRDGVPVGTGSERHLQPDDVGASLVAEMRFRDLLGNSYAVQTAPSAMVTGRWGTQGSDIITGTTLAEDITGLGGDDWIRPVAGNDTVDGGSGRDMLSFVDATAAASVSLATGIATVMRQAPDTITFRNIESVTGTIFGDLITGDAGANRLRGLGNYDWMIGSGGGDTFEGGTGRDTVAYSAATAGVTANLLTDKGTGGQAQGDRFVAIENLTGSSHADHLTGDDGTNSLRGLGGDDFIFGMGGNDTIDGGASRDSIFGGAGNDRITGGRGNDKIDGGSGWDTAIYSGALSDYVVETSAVGGRALATVRHSILFGDDQDVLSGIEVLQFSDGRLFL